MRIAKDKQKEKSADEKQYELLKSIYDQVEEELYCLKKQEQMLLKMIENEQIKLSIQNGLALSAIQTQELKSPYNLRKKHQCSHDIDLQVKQKTSIISHIPLSLKQQIDITGTYLYTGHKANEVAPQKSSKRQDIFRMDQQLYEQDDDQSYEIHQ